MSNDLITRLLAAIEDTEKRRYERHEFGCASFDNCGTCRSGPFACDCAYPQAIARRCEGDRRILAEHVQRDGRCVRCVAHPASTDQWIGVEVGASHPCETVIALAHGYGIEAPE